MPCVSKKDGEDIRRVRKPKVKECSFIGNASPIPVVC
jgi:hypothetical protein